MDCVESVTFIFHDRRWPKKMGLATVASFLPIAAVGWIVLGGWCIEIFRRAADDAEEKLPEWQGWRNYLPDGLALFGVEMIWGLVVFAISAALGWPWWILMIPAGVLLSGSLAVLARAGGFKQAVNPVVAWRALGPRNWRRLLIALGVAIVVALWSYYLANLFMLGLLLDQSRYVVASLLLGLCGGPWATAIAGNLIGRAYREYGADIWQEA